MHIVFFAHFAGSPKHGMVYGHYYLAREWVRMGHDVTIVAASFAHTRFHQPESPRQAFNEEIIDGIRYIWVKCSEYNPDNKLARIGNIFTFFGKCFLLNLPLSPCDVVISSSHYPFAIWPARKLARINNARLITEIRDLWPLTLIELGGASRLNPLILMMQLAENTAYRISDKIVSVLSNSKSYMVKHGMHPSKFLYIPNGIVTDGSPTLDLPNTHIQKLDELRRNGTFLVGYAGRMGTANALDKLIEAIAKISDRKVCAVLLGDGYAKKDLQQYADKLNLNSRVTFLPPVDKSQVPGFLEAMDVLFVGLQDKPIFRYGVSPTKLNDYLLTAKPTIFAINTENEAANESEAVMVCRPEDSSHIASTIQTLREMPAEHRHLMGQKGRDWILANRSYNRLAEQFLSGIFQ
jgi:glycosyltransferase involved in cell wall biosynthesis